MTKIEQLEAENFRLAADQCIHPLEGLTNTEWGDQYCLQKVKAIGFQEDLRRALHLLARCARYVQFDADMMADITRHAPLDPESQKKHDETESESEKLMKEISAFMISTLRHF